MVPLVDVVRFMLDRHEAQAVAARGLVRLAQQSADPVHPPMPVGHIRACGCPECVAWLEAHEPADL